MTINSPRGKRFSRFCTSNRETTEVELDSDAVQLSLDGGVAIVTLDAPAVRNAPTVKVTTDVREALDLLSDAARCVVVRGSDEAGVLYTGGDVNAMHELQADAMTLPEAVDHVVRDTADYVRRVYECDLSTVAAIDGPAVGAGAMLAIACDLQLLHDDVAVSFGFRRVGLAVDSGMSYLLPRLVGCNIAMELVYTGEELGPDRALEFGVVNHVAGTDEFKAELATLAEHIADGPTKAFAVSKRLLRRPDDSVEAVIEYGASAQAVMFETDGHAEDVALFASRREPEFEGT